MATVEKDNYVCVHCGKPVAKLYKKYSPTVLKLCSCGFCGNIADKYLEYDKIIILIDLVLFSREAYRHVLFNIQYKSYIKLAFLLLLILSCDEWFYGKNAVKFEDSDLYELRFYIVCVTTVLGKILFYLVILFFLNIYHYYEKTEGQDIGKINALRISKAIVCSSFGYFLLLTILIWDDQREIHLIFIHVYTLLSQIQALTVTTTVPRVILGMICALANAADHLASMYLRISLGV